MYILFVCRRDGVACNYYEALAAVRAFRCLFFSHPASSFDAVAKRVSSGGLCALGTRFDHYGFVFFFFFFFILYFSFIIIPFEISRYVTRRNHVSVKCATYSHDVRVYICVYVSGRVGAQT